MPRIAFQEQLSLLCELQEIDLSLHNLEQSLKTLPNKMKVVEAAYLAVKTELESTRAELSEVEKAKRSDESDLASSAEHLRVREAKLYAIKTNKEYQAALKEVSEGKRLNREREDRILQAMEKIETLTKKNTQLEQDFADKEDVFKKEEKSVRSEEALVREKISIASRHRPEIVSKIDKTTIRKYDFIRQRYAQAVAGVIDGICQGCSTRIPPQLFNEMLRRTDLKICPSCQRLIYVMEAPPVEEENSK